MAKLSIGEKAHRVLRFIMGLRTPGAVSALSKYGFTEADLRTGRGAPQPRDASSPDPDRP
jgi:hypothetical protein